MNKPPDARDRAYTFYLGDSWEPYQFTPGRIEGVSRKGSVIRWSKVMKSPVPGTNIRVKYSHVLDGPEHRIRIEVMGRDAEGLQARLRLCPYFHQGWDNDYTEAAAARPASTPDPLRVGQERNVFARVGTTEFAYSEPNIIPRRERIYLRPGRGMIDILNRNPGRDRSVPGWTIDDNPDMNRGFTLPFDGTGASVEFVDPPGPRHYVTAIVNMGRHSSGRVYEFTFRYRHGAI